MSRTTLKGYAVIGKKWASKGTEVKGIGTNKCEAWADTCQNVCNGRVAVRDMPIEYPNLKCVEAKITVTY